MAWQKELDDINYRRYLSRQLRDPESMAQQHAQRKLTARERIAALADSRSFQEVSSLAGKATYKVDKLVDFAPSPSIVGLCTLDNRRVVINADNPSSTGIVPGTDIGYKMGYAQRLALDWRLPYIRLLEPTGMSVLEVNQAARTYLPDNDTAAEALQLLDTVPVVSAVMGSVSGLHATEACLGHFSVMVKGSQISINDPDVIETLSGNDITDEEARGMQLQACSSGIIDNLAENEEEAFSIVRRFLSYLPDNVWEIPPCIESTDDPNRRDEELLSIIPEARNKLYDPYEILRHVLDQDSLFEIAPFYGQSSITALARVNGYPVGVMIKNPLSPSVGAMDVAAGQKVVRFFQLCDTFHLPLVYFVDEPGFMVGLEAQKEGIVRAGARVVLTGMQTKMPWISFIVRQLYGVAGCLTFRNNGMCKHYGWVTANWGGMHIEGGAAAAYRQVIDSAPDPEAKRREIEHYLWSLSSPFRTAEAFEVQDIIDPRDTRPLLCAFVVAAQAILKSQLGPGSGPTYLP